MFSVKRYNIINRKIIYIFIFFLLLIVAIAIQRTDDILRTQYIVN